MMNDCACHMFLAKLNGQSYKDGTMSELLH